jgi:hypothetical protein
MHVSHMSLAFLVIVIFQGAQLNPKESTFWFYLRDAQKLTGDSAGAAATQRYIDEKKLKPDQE